MFYFLFKLLDAYYLLDSRTLYIKLAVTSDEADEVYISNKMIKFSTVLVASSV